MGRFGQFFPIPHDEMVADDARGHEADYAISHCTADMPLVHAL